MHAPTIAARDSFGKLKKLISSSSSSSFFITRGVDLAPLAGVVINLPPARLEATSEHKRKHFDVTNMCAILSGGMEEEPLLAALAMACAARFVIETRRSAIMRSL